MINPIQLCEVAKLHQREVEVEVASRQITNQTNTPKRDKIGSIKRAVLVNFSSHKNRSRVKVGEAYSQ